jgi:hypothetical protein
LGLPRPNQIDDVKRALEIQDRIAELKQIGPALMAAGDAKGARQALEEYDELVELLDLMAERWKSRWAGSVEHPEQPRRWKAMTAGRRR